MTNQVAQPKDTKRADELRQTAAHVFYKNGYAGTSVQDLADAMGILKGSIYHHVKSKQDLLFEIVKGIHDEGPVRVAAIRKLRADPNLKFCLFVYIGVEFTLTKREQVAIFLNDYRYLGENHKLRLRRRRRIYSKFLSTLIREGIAQGLFHDDLDPQLSARAIIGALNALCFSRRDQDVHRLALHYAAQMARSLFIEPLNPDRLFEEYVEPILGDFRVFYEQETRDKISAKENDQQA